MNSNTATDISMAYFVTVTKMTTNNLDIGGAAAKVQESKTYCFPYYFRTDEKKGLGCLAKSLISNVYLVGDASFELATPAV